MQVNDVTEPTEATWKSLTSEDPSTKNLTTLDLPHNNIDTRIAISLSKNTSWKNLTTLYLQWNNIGADGAAELSKNTSWTNLTTLNLQWNNIRDEGAARLSEKFFIDEPYNTISKQQ